MEPELQANMNFLAKNWESLPKDIKFYILNKIEPDDLQLFCQTNKVIANFCRENKLTLHSRLLAMNPQGELIDTNFKKAELIKRGFETIYSLVLNEKEQDNGERGDYFFATNMPDPKDIQALELVFGMNNGTDYFTASGNDHKLLMVHLTVIGLPPPQGTLVNFLLVISFGVDDWEITARYYLNKEDLIKHLQNRGREEYPSKIYKSIVTEPGILDQFLTNGRIVVGHEVAQLYSLPSP
jgi:hypothetical protein